MNLHREGKGREREGRREGDGEEEEERRERRELSHLHFVNSECFSVNTHALSESLN